MNSERAWCDVCSKTVDAFVKSVGQSVGVPLLTAALGGAVAHGGRRRASLLDVAFGAGIGLVTGLAINATSQAAQHWICGECGSHVA
jgi:hypothetical protein